MLGHEFEVYMLDSQDLAYHEDNFMEHLYEVELNTHKTITKRLRLQIFEVDASHLNLWEVQAQVMNPAVTEQVYNRIYETLLRGTEWSFHTSDFKNTHHRMFKNINSFQTIYSQLYDYNDYDDAVDNAIDRVCDIVTHREWEIFNQNNVDRVDYTKWKNEFSESGDADIKKVLRKHLRKIKSKLTDTLGEG